MRSEFVLNVEKEMASLTEDEIGVCAECGKRNGLTENEIGVCTECGNRNGLTDLG